MIGHTKKPARSAVAEDSGNQRLPRRKPGTALADDDDARHVHRQLPAAETADPEFSVMSASSDVTGLRDMYALVRRNAALILLMVLLSLGLGTAYLAFAPPRYIASATLLIDPAVSSIPEEYYIESQTQMMRSDLVVRAVIEQLDLVEAGIEQDDRSFLVDNARAAKRFVGQFVLGLESSPEDADPVQRAVSTLRRNLTIMRPAMTPVISITYNSTDPDRAADVVNTLVHTYTSQRRGDETAGVQQSIGWLSQRLDGLRQQLEDAEHATESFRTANNIVGAGTNHSLQAEQRLYELGMQLDVARAAADQVRARDGSMQDISENAFDMLMEMPPAGSEIAMLSKRPAIPANSRNDGLAEKHDEDAKTYGDDLAGVRTRASLQQAFEEAAQRASEMNRQRTRLRELEASAEIYRTLHGNMLQRYEEAVQQGLLPINDGAQVLIAARRPGGKSYPRPLLVFAFAGMFGVALGVGAAAARGATMIAPTDRS